MNSYNVGDLVRITAVFTVEGVPTNPTTTTFEIREPSGTVTTYVYGTDAQLQRPSTGSFRVEWTPDQEGVHHVRWTGTGAAQAVGERSFNIREGLF